MMSCKRTAMEVPMKGAAKAKAQQSEKEMGREEAKEQHRAPKQAKAAGLNGAEK